MNKFISIIIVSLLIYWVSHKLPYVFIVIIFILISFSLSINNKYTELKIKYDELHEEVSQYAQVHDLKKEQILRIKRIL